MNLREANRWYVSAGSLAGFRFASRSQTPVTKKHGPHFILIEIGEGELLVVAVDDSWTIAPSKHVGGP